jgi:hypothetical protein
MGAQQSQKQGVKSSAHKEETARNAYAPLPASNPVGGAFGDAQPTTQTDEELIAVFGRKA